MNRENNEKFIVFVTTLASAGLVIENFLMGWEFWVPPVVIAGVISLLTHRKRHKRRKLKRNLARIRRTF